MGLNQRKNDKRKNFQFANLSKKGWKKEIAKISHSASGKGRRKKKMLRKTLELMLKGEISSGVFRLDAFTIVLFDLDNVAPEKSGSPTDLGFGQVFLSHSWHHSTNALTWKPL